MNVTVTVPTIGKINPVTKSMLVSLNKQSFTDFKVYFIVPRYCQKENLLPILEETELDFEIVHQDRTGFENAMNTAIKLSGDINLNLDDDAIYGSSHVKSYIDLFENTGAGMIFGRVNGIRPYMNKTLFFLGIQNWANGSPIIDPLKKYAVFFNSAGFLSASIGSLILPFRNVRLNASPIGVNMGWRKDALKDFSLREYSRKGTINEAYGAFHAVSNGFEVYETKSIDVKHENREGSLSRGSLRRDNEVKMVELLFSPLILNTYIRIDPQDFDRTSTKLKKIMSKIPSHLKNKFIESLETVNIGIRENWNLEKIIGAYNKFTKSGDKNGGSNNSS
jgi:hypothetical protein